MNISEETKRHDFFRFSLLGFAFMTLSSPFFVLLADRGNYGGCTPGAPDLLLFAYPAIGTMVCALFLANSTVRTLEAAKILAIPTLAFGLFGLEILSVSYDPIGLWILLFANIWLSGILRQRAYQEGHATSTYLLLAHQLLGIAFTLACCGSSGEFALLLGVGYWFGAIGCYFSLWLESRHGPSSQSLKMQEPAVEL